MEQSALKYKGADNDGFFWMCWEDFREVWTEITICSRSTDASDLAMDVHEELGCIGEGLKLLLWFEEDHTYSCPPDVERTVQARMHVVSRKMFRNPGQCYKPLDPSVVSCCRPMRGLRARLCNVLVLVPWLPARGLLRE